VGNAALNWTWVPMTAVFGVTVIAGDVYAAVTVVLAFIVTLQVTVVAELHPVHEVKAWEPAVAGAVIVTDAPELYVRVKVALPLAEPFTSAGATVMATPVVGLVVFTVNV